MFAELRAYAESISNLWLKQLVLSLIGDPEMGRWEKRAPAAKVMHHAYIGGLLEHVISICGMARRVAAHYPELDVDLLLTAAILHDIGKLDELCYERAIGYTTPGQLLGHIVMELETVTRASDKIPLVPRLQSTRRRKPPAASANSSPSIYMGADGVCPDRVVTKATR